MKLKHLPYIIDPKGNRNHYYETYWKIVGLGLIKKHFPNTQGETLLDFGCGRGETLSLYGAEGYDVTGTDTDEDCVRLSSAHGKAELLDTSCPLEQFGEKSFDYVVCYHVLEHVPCPVETVNILSRIARKGVVIAVPNLHTITRLFSRRTSASIVNEGHLQSWDHGHLQNLAERHGNLELIEWGFDTTILPIINRFGPALLGQKAMIWLETKVFTKLFPYHGLSIIGIFKPL